MPQLTAARQLKCVIWFNNVLILNMELVELMVNAPVLTSIKVQAALM